MYIETGIIHDIKDAVRMRLEYKRHYQDEAYAADKRADVFVVLSTLLPRNFKEWKFYACSYNVGADILEAMLPAQENPIVVLDKGKIIQMIEQGEEAGFNRGWMEIGFEWQAELRGIPLEQGFFSTVSPSLPTASPL